MKQSLFNRSGLIRAFVMGLLILSSGSVLWAGNPYGDRVVTSAPKVSSNAVVKSFVANIRQKIADGMNVAEQFIQVAVEKVHQQKIKTATQPVPMIGVLKEKFPESSLPGKLVGTTLDWAGMPKPEKGETAAQFTERRQEFCDDVMVKAREMGFNSMRLGAYWSQIQPKADAPPDFGYLDELLASAKDHGINVTLAVGAKSPGPPEFYIPAWAQTKMTQEKGRNLSEDPIFRARAKAFVRLVANRYAEDETIGMWQVENEPFERFNGSMNCIGTELLQEEIDILRQADDHRRPVLINVWCENTTANRNNMKKAFQMADVVALDVYYNTPGSEGRVSRTVLGPTFAVEQARKAGKPLMIGELQADNWGAYQANAADVKALADQMASLGIRDLFFWRMDQNLANNAKGDTSLDQAESEIAKSRLGEETRGCFKLP